MLSAEELNCASTCHIKVAVSLANFFDAFHPHSRVTDSHFLVPLSFFLNNVTL